MGNNKAEERERKGTRSSRQPKASTKVEFGSHVFRRVELTEQEKSDCKANYMPGESPIGVLCDLAIPGYKVSQSWDNEGRTASASVTCTDKSDPNAGGIITARAADIPTAIMVLGYKVLVICGDRLWAEVEHERGGGYSDIG